jgi:hypothetical protein
MVSLVGDNQKEINPFGFLLNRNFFIWDSTVSRKLSKFFSRTMNKIPVEEIHVATSGIGRRKIADDELAIGF